MNGHQGFIVREYVVIFSISKNIKYEVEQICLF